MEIVCGSLTGINRILKEIDFDPSSPTFLTNQDFAYKKRIKLKSLEILSPEYFENMKANEQSNF